MKEILQNKETVTIQGEEYNVRELSLAEKIKLLAPIEEVLSNIAKNAFFKRKEDKSIFVDFYDEISLGDLKIDKIVIYFVQQLPEILKLSVPDFTDWENLPESESREARVKALKVNDFKGFIVNFISLGTALIQ